MPNTRICARLMSCGSVTSMNGDVPRLAASPLAVNQDVWRLPSITRSGGLLEKKLLALAIVPGRRFQEYMLTPSKLRAWRESHGLTLEELSDLTGLSIAMLSRAERGERQLSPLRRVEVARLLRVRVRDLFPVPEPKEVEHELAASR